MKKLVAAIVALAIPLSAASAVYGTDEEPGSIDPGTAAVMIEESIRNTYEASVIEQLVGRCGMTYKGAKGLVFEIVTKDKLNFKNLFNKEFTTRLAFSPNSPRADLVAVNSSGQNVYYYQCKNATSQSGISKIYNQVKNGKYPWTKLIGPSETAEAYNNIAAANGSTSSMIDSGISADTTERIANKALRLGPNMADAAKVGVKTGALGAGINAAVSLVSCIIHHKSFSETVGKVSVQSIKGFVTSFGTGYLVELTGAALVAAEAGAISCIIIPAAVGVGTGIVACYVLDKVIDVTEVETKVAELTDAFGDKVKAAAAKGKEMISTATGFIGDVAESVSGTVTEDVIPAVKGAFDTVVLKTKAGMIKFGLNAQ